MNIVKLDQLWDVATGTGDWKRAWVINVINGRANLRFDLERDPGIETVAVDDMLRRPHKYRFFGDSDEPGA